MILINVELLPATLDSGSSQGPGKKQEECANGERAGEDPRIPDVAFLLFVSLQNESPGPVGDLRGVQVGA